MKACIKNLQAQYPKTAQWAWFIGLWLTGFGVLLLISSTIKLMFYFLK